MRTISILLASILLSLCPSPDPVAARNVNFASNTPTLSGTLPLIVAQEFGFFAAEAIDVKTVFIRGGPTAMAALVGGGVDYTFVGGGAAVRAIAQNAPMINSQLKLRTHWASGPTRPLSNRYDSMPANNRIAAAT